MSNTFQGRIGRTIADSTPYRPAAPKAPPGAPNILVVLFDDTGFSDFGCYGSPIRTPTIDRLAAEGLCYTGLHTTAMCSTTRAAMLTGRNPHSVGVGSLANFDSGYPGYRGKIRREAGTIAEILRLHGWRNYMVGKWHVTPLTEAGSTGPFDGWPLGRGFDRYYGFMDAETDHYAPELVLDNSAIDPPGCDESGYHLTADLVDRSIQFLAGHIAEKPDPPGCSGSLSGPPTPRTKRRVTLSSAMTRCSPVAGTWSGNVGSPASSKWGSCPPARACRRATTAYSPGIGIHADERRFFTASPGGIRRHARSRRSPARAPRRLP